MKIYIGNISRESTEEEVRELFSVRGAIENFKLIRDQVTGQLKGFGFIDMPNDEEAQKAIDELNGFEFKERKLTVSISAPSPVKKKKPKSPQQPSKNQGFQKKKTIIKGGQFKGSRPQFKGGKKISGNGNGNVNGNREGGNEINGFDYNYYNNY